MKSTIFLWEFDWDGFFLNLGNLDFMFNLAGGPFKPMKFTLLDFGKLLSLAFGKLGIVFGKPSTVAAVFFAAPGLLIETVVGAVRDLRE